jgi:hypothetical protein
LDVAAHEGGQAHRAGAVEVVVHGPNVTSLGATRHLPR